MPQTAPNRVAVIDALRGFALAGIVIAHMFEQFTAAPRPTEGWVVADAADGVIGLFVWILVYGKFYSLFALLFGISFGIMMERAASRGENFSGRFLWRLTLLLGVGLFHCLLYRGDILTAYAVIGFSLPLFYHLADRWLWLVGTALMLGVGQLLVFAAIGKASFLPWQTTPDSPAVIGYIELLKHGSLREIAAENISHGLAHKFDFLFAVYGRAYMTLAYFLLGMWLVRRGIIAHLDDYKKPLKKIMLWSLAIAPVCFLLAMTGFALMPELMTFSQWRHVLMFSFYNWFNVALTLALASAFVLLYLRKPDSRLRIFCAYGRMALSNYIVQSVIGVMIFFGFGLGMLGRLHDWQTVSLALLVIAGQMALSTAWLRRFRFGPLEWLWRCATYRKWISITRASASTARTTQTP